jgi:hypothetical protein
MGDATRAYFLNVVSEVLDLLEVHAVVHLVIGSIADAVHLDDGWATRSDFDLLVTHEDAERCLEIFPEHGYATHVRDESWIYKMAKPNVTVDLIFRSANRIELTREMMERSVVKPFETRTVRVPSVEDMAVQYVLMDSENRPGNWYVAMQYLRRVGDWRYLADRGRELAPRKVLAALLYGQEIGIEVPADAVCRLTSAVG